MAWTKAVAVGWKGKICIKSSLGLSDQWAAGDSREGLHMGIVLVESEWAAKTQEWMEGS